MESELAIDPPDLVHIDMLFIAPLIGQTNSTPAILSQNNVEVQNRKRWVNNQGAWIHRTLFRIDAAKLERWEQYWLNAYKACIAVSEADAAYFRSCTPGQSVFVVPNGVDLEAFKPPTQSESDRKDIIFFGALGYPANSEAVIHFCKDIFPLIIKEKADVRVSILGAHAPEEVTELGQMAGV
ncbi:unnamed protein product, partial [marine sediment metagenome]